MATLLAIFIPLVLVLSLVVSRLSLGVLGMLIADAIAIGFVYYLYVIWDKRPIRLRCPGCKKIVLSNTPWVCQFCKEPNRNANEHSFVDKCGHCGDEPKAYKCHHCNELIFLSDDEDNGNYAYALNSPAEVSEQNQRVEKVNRYEHQKQDKKYEIEMAKLDAELLEAKDRQMGPKIKSPYQQKKESLDHYFDGVMAAKEIAIKKKAENAITFKDHPEDLKDADHAVDEWLKRNS